MNDNNLLCRAINRVIAHSRAIAFTLMLVSAILFSFSSYMGFLPVYRKTLHFNHYDSQAEDSSIKKVLVPDNEYLFLKKSVELSGDFSIQPNLATHPYMGLMQTSQINDGIRIELGSLPDDKYSINIVLNSKSSKDGIVGVSYGNPPYHLMTNQWYRINAKLTNDNVLSGSLFLKNENKLSVIIPYFVTGVDVGVLRVNEIKVGTGYDDSRQFQGQITDFTITYTYFLPIFLNTYGGVIAIIFLLLSLFFSRFAAAPSRHLFFAKHTVIPLSLITLVYMYPVLQFYSVNMININFSLAAKIAFLVGFFGSSLFVILAVVYKDINKAFIASIFLAFVLSFTGRLYEYVFTGIDPDLFVFIISLAAIFVHFALLKVNSISDTVMNFFKIFVYLLLVMCAFSLVSNGFTLWRESRANGHALAVEGSKDVSKPDIYFIVSDMYAGEPSLFKHMNYNNDSFLSHLKSKGFFVATNAASNYAYTWFSIPSMLNMSYLPSDITSFPQLREYYDKNDFAQYLKSIGYAYIHVITRPIILAKSNIADVNFTCGKTSDFEGTLWDYSFFFRLNTLADAHRNDVLCGFIRIKEAALMKGPKFVFVHILSPHFPYVFDSNGGKVAPDQQNDFKISSTVTEINKDGYLHQLQFISKQLAESVDFILAHSAKTPIIILQGDHGFSLHNKPGAGALPPDEVINARLRPLGAYLFPAGGDSVLYDTITPVNMTRGLMRYYFHRQDMPKVEDKAYWSNLDVPPKFTDVTAIIRKHDLADSL